MRRLERVKPLIRIDLNIAQESTEGEATVNLFSGYVTQCYM